MGGVDWGRWTSTQPAIHPWGVPPSWPGSVIFFKTRYLPVGLWGYKGLVGPPLEAGKRPFSPTASRRKIFDPKIDTHKLGPPLTPSPLGGTPWVRGGDPLPLGLPWSGQRLK